jgi:hypothetical protein
MRRAALALAILFSLALPALAVDTGLGLMGVSSGTVASSYVGAGDIVASATAWYGLRAYNAAYATGSNNAVNVRRASDNSTQNIVILSTGALDIATANTFAGTDATASCTIATTVATCTGASSTPHTGSTITGSGVQNPCYIVSVGSFAGGAGTVNLGGTGTSPCGTISVAVTLTFQYGLYLPEIYDQTGNSHNVLQATASNQPQLLPICSNSLPCVYFAGSAHNLVSATITTIPQPITITYVAQAADTTDQENILTAINGGNGIETGFGKATTAAYIYASNFVTTTSPVSINVLHAAQNVFSSTSSVICVDGTCATGLNAGTYSAVNNIILGTSSAGGGQPLIGYFTEGGLWAVAFNSTQYGNMCHNQYTYWTTGASC